MSNIRAALLGVENPHSMGHLRTLNLLPEITGISIWAENEEAAASVRALESPKTELITTDLDELLADEGILFAVASLRNDLAPGVCCQALAAGKHIMAEKPIGVNAAAVESVVTAADQAGLQLGVCYQNRSHPVVQDARAILAQDLLGPLMLVDARVLTTAVRLRKPKNWLFSAERAGGGMLSWLGCHYIDMIRYTTQDEIVSVMAETAIRSGEEIDVEDVATLSLRLRSGAVVSLTAGYVLAVSGEGYPNGKSYDTYIGVHGRAGRMYWSSSHRPLQLSVETTHPAWKSAHTRQFEYVLGESRAYAGAYGEEFMRAFMRATQGHGAPVATGKDALQVARIVDAAYESNRTGRRVEVPPPLT